MSNTHETKLITTPIGEFNFPSDHFGSVVTEAEINSFLKSFINESERGAVLALAAAFDEVLSRALRKQLEKSDASKKLLDKVFEFNGSLGTFASRIDMARCLGLISEQLHKDIHLIRKLRNEAAHHWFDFKLNEDKVRDFVDPIKSYLPFFDRDPEANLDAKELPTTPVVKLSTMALHLISIGARPNAQPFDQEGSPSGMPPTDGCLPPTLATEKLDE